VRTEQGVKALESQMGLDKPVYVQYLTYINAVAHGDLGHSWFTGQSVSTDLVERAPATIELIGYSLLVAIVFGLTLGASAAARSGVWMRVGRASKWSIRLAGSLPDFWIGLLGIYIFFHLLGWAPAPLGRLDVSVAPPTRITGLYTIDSLLTGNWSTLVSSVAHLVLPVLTLGGILGLIVGRVAAANTINVEQSDYVRYARASGLPARVVRRYIRRNALPPVVTLGGVLFAYLIGGAVLMEKVFTWGGVGQYAVQAVVNADYAAIQGFLLVAAAATMLVYLAVDLIHMRIDPRVAEYARG
jgi:peptide/nickel transport system permease protein